MQSQWLNSRRFALPVRQFDFITYAQLEYMINNLTRAVLSLGFERGQIVGILLQDKIFHIALVIALTRIGVVTVSCRNASLPKELNAAAAITDVAGPFRRRRAGHSRQSGVGQRAAPRQSLIQGCSRPKEMSFVVLF